MASKYLEIKSTSSYGFTIRIFYEEKLGVVTLTDMQLQSTKYNGTWFMGGTISINDELMLEMSYNNPATHAFSFYSVGETFVNVQTINSGKPLPISSKRIVNASKATISADIRLYRDSSTGKPTLVGSTDVPVAIGFVYIDNGSKFEPYEIYIDNGTSWDRYIAYIDNGTGWDQCN